MFPLYPYVASFHVPEEGFKGHLGADVRMVFWNVSIPAYDQYGFAGYQQVDFGEYYNLSLGSSYLAYSNGKVAVSLFYNNTLTGNISVDTEFFSYDYRDYGGSIALSPLKWISLGVDALLTPQARGGGVDVTLRYEYLTYVSASVFYLNSKEVLWDASAFLALPDPRMSSVGIYLTNRYAPSLLLRYETNITRDRRLKLGGGFLYDSTYVPLLSFGERERLGKFDLGADVTVFPVERKLRDKRVNWNDVKVSVWIGF